MWTNLSYSALAKMQSVTLELFISLQMYVEDQLLRYNVTFPAKKNIPMNYRTEKNDRTRRRKARTFTALLTLVLLAGFAYASGLLEEIPQWFDEAPATEMVTTPVAKA